MSEKSERYLLQKLGDDDEPVKPPVFRTHIGTSTNINLAQTWATAVEAVEAAPGHGWMIVPQRRLKPDERK